MKTILFILFCILFFLTFNAPIFHISILNNSDEVLLVLSLIVIISHLIKDLFYYEITKINFVLILYFSYQIINYYLSPFELSLPLTLIQSAINIKVFLVTLSAILLYVNTQSNNKIITTLWKIFIALFIISFSFNIILGETWNHIFNETISYRYGFIRPIGYFMHYAPNAYFFVLTFITLLLIYSKRKVINISTYIKKFFLFLIIDFIMAFPLTVRKGMLMNIPFGLFLLNLLNTKTKLIFLFFSMLFISLFLFVINDLQMMKDTIDNFSNFTHDNHTYIRGLMFYYGIGLFLEFFPFGVGAATFGTTLSKYNTLDVYTYVGLDLQQIYDETNNKLMGVYDSGFASMMAENGFIGMVLIGLFIYYFFKFNKARLDWYNYEVFKILTIFTLLMSFTEPAWQNGLYTIFYVINVLFIYTKNGIFKENKDNNLLERKN